MSEFNFKSQICTDRIQSERLLALGLKKETADMCWIFSYHWECFVGNPEELYTPDEDGCDDVYIPAWSLGRLWELYWSNKVVSDCLFGCGKYMNPYAKMIAMIEYDIEDGTFNKDYLDK